MTLDKTKFEGVSLDLTKPVQTRDGRPARIVCTDRKCDNGFPLGVLIPNEYGVEEFFWHCADGRFNDSPSAPSNLDLQNVPVITMEWVPYYADYSSGKPRESLQKAKIVSGDCAIAFLKITRKDGDIVDVSLA